MKKYYLIAFVIAILPLLFYFNYQSDFANSSQNSLHLVFYGYIVVIALTSIFENFFASNFGILLQTHEMIPMPTTAGLIFVYTLYVLFVIFFLFVFSAIRNVYLNK
jgi:hypothetical protein